MNWWWVITWFKTEVFLHLFYKLIFWPNIYNKKKFEFQNLRQKDEDTFYHYFEYKDLEQQADV